MKNMNIIFKINLAMTMQIIVLPFPIENHLLIMKDHLIHQFLEFKRFISYLNSSHAAMMYAAMNLMMIINHEKSILLLSLHLWLSLRQFVSLNQ